MSLQLVSEIWNLVSESIPLDDREQIAYNFIGVLVEHGYELDDIDYEFSDDDDLRSAIKYHRDDVENESSEDEDFLDDEELDEY